MARPTYYELLRHPLWQEMRLRIMDRAGFSCERCGTKEVTLNVHHKQYKKGAKPWEYGEHELQCLCEECHEELHYLDGVLKSALVQLSDGEVERVRGYALGLQSLRYSSLGFEIHFRSEEATIGAGAAIGLTAKQSISLLFGKTLTSDKYAELRDSLSKDTP